MATVRKFKMKSLKGKSVVKSRPIFIGLTQEGEPIIMYAETLGFLDTEYNKALGELHNEYKLPKKVKPLFQFTKDEQVFMKSILGDDTKENAMITTFDETHPDFIAKKTEIDNLKTLITLASFLKMDAEITIDTEDGEKTVSQWEYLGINKKIGLLGLAKHLADKKEGLGLTDVEINRMAQEIELLKKGYETVGEKYLKENEKLEELKQESIKELEKVKTKIEEVKEVEDDDTV